MLKTGLFTLIITIVFLAVAAYFYTRSSVYLDVKQDLGDYFPKEKVHMQLTFKNYGFSGRYFFIDIKSDLQSFPPRVMYLKKNAVYESFIDVIIPSSAPKGIYHLDVSAGTMRFMPFGNKSKPAILAKKSVTVAVKDLPLPEIKIVEPKKIVKIEKPPEPISGKLNFVSFPEELSYNAATSVLLSVENTSGRAAQFVVQFNAAGPGGTPKTFFSEISIASGTSSNQSFEFAFDAEEPAGQYFASAELREPITNRLIHSDSVVSQLTDVPPKTELKDFIVSPMEKNRYEVIANISDDTGVSGAEMHYMDLARNYTTSYRMNLIYGNTGSGLWSCSFIPYKKSKDFKFIIESHDIRNNASQSEEYSSVDFLFKSFIGKVK